MLGGGDIKIYLNFPCNRKWVVAGKALIDEGEPSKLSAVVNNYTLLLKVEGDFLSNTLETTARENLGVFFDSGDARKKSKYVSSLYQSLS